MSKQQEQPCNDCPQVRRLKAMPRRSQQETKATRVTFHKPGSDDVVASLWVYCGEPGVLTLQCDYPRDEFAPEVGWIIKGQDLNVTITAVDGRKLSVR